MQTLGECATLLFVVGDDQSSSLLQRQVCYTNTEQKITEIALYGLRAE